MTKTNVQNKQTNAGEPHRPAPSSPSKTSIYGLKAFYNREIFALR